MSAFNTATLLLFPGLGLVAVAIGLLVRRYSVPAFVVGLVGLLTLTTASTWITAAGPMTDTTQLAKLTTDNAKLKDTIAKQQLELEDARKRPREPGPEMAEVDRLDRDLRAEQSKRAETQRNAAELNEKLSEVRIGKVEAEHKAALLEEKLRGVQSTPAPPKPPDLPSIRRKLTDGNLPYYATQVAGELIPGRKGSWYVVHLLQGGRDWNFADRQFVLPDAKEIKVSAARLRDDVLRPLSQAGQRWQLFARGVADPRRVFGPVGRELSYLPRLSDGTYSPEPKGKQVALPVQNEDLPTLRADWLREIVRPVVGDIGAGDIETLENPPQPGHGRTAELVLFVEW